MDYGDGPFMKENRVALHPATNWWAKGARFGSVVADTHDADTNVAVRLDVNDKVVIFHRALIRKVD